MSTDPVVDNPVVTTLTVSPANVSLGALGATQQLTATVQDQNGNTMSGATSTWWLHAEHQIDNQPNASDRLAGTLLVTAEPETPTQATGELVFREGVYCGRGQNLTIDPGRLMFGGPINNPTLDVRTYRVATDGTEAGLLIRGELATPEVEVWSDPAMSESDALGYMIFGRKFD